MINIFISLSLATTLGIGATAYYGAENLWQHPWVEYTTWVVISAGFFSEAIRWVYPSSKVYAKRLTQLINRTASARFENSSDKNTRF